METRDLLLAIFAIFQLFLIQAGHSAAVPKLPKVAEELILTPFIKTGEIEKARAASEDSWDQSKLTTTPVQSQSYSGFFIIDEAANSNLFFWFFPAQENPEKAPVILYINEAPGLSVLTSIFVENGPYHITEKDELERSNSAWTKFASMLYIDAPVGTGFSFSQRVEAFAKDSDDEAQEVYEALTQFFTVFKEFQAQDFYLAGSGYAGTFIPHIAKKIDEENPKAELKMNLRGFLVDSPFIDIGIQSDKFSEFYYVMGFVDETQRNSIASLRDSLRASMESGDFSSTLSVIEEVYNVKNSHLANYTVFSYLTNVLDSKRPTQLERFEKLIQSKEIKKFLHVGSREFIEQNSKVLEFFLKDFLSPHKEYLQELLDKDYKILFLASQFNLAVPPTGVTEMVNSLDWKGAEDFKTAPRNVWRVEDDVAGYVKTSGNFTFVMIRNAGAHSSQDQPQWMLDLLQRYLNGVGFDEKV